MIYLYYTIVFAKGHL